MSTSNPDYEAKPVGISALSLVEALLLQLVEKDVLTVEDVDEIFSAAIAAHETAHAEYGDLTKKRVVDILRKLQVHGNSVRL